MSKHANTARLKLKAGNRRVTRAEILQATKEYDVTRRGKQRDATKRGRFVLEHQRRYHPNWLLKLATGAAIHDFKGSEGRKALKALGYDLRRDKFSAESDLQSTVRNNIGWLDPGLEITDGGKEKPVKSGRPDITAKDRHGVTVVIELKNHKAGRNALAQILGYMGDFTKAKKKIRGFLVAHEFGLKATAAARAVPSLRLKKYDTLLSKLNRATAK